MAITTLIASQAASGVIPKYNATGVQVVTSVYSLTATLTVGDIIQFCKLPNKARVVGGRIGWNVAVSAASGGDTTFNVGTRTDPDMFVVTASCMSVRSVAFDAVAGLAAELSLSDGATTRHTVIEAVVGGATGTGTKSGAISCIVFYVCDQPED